MRRTRTVGLIVILAAALTLRLTAGLSQDARLPYAGTGGDSWWYLVNGAALASGQTVVRGIVTDVSRLPTPPLYPLLLGWAQAWFPENDLRIYPPMAALPFSHPSTLRAFVLSVAPDDGGSAGAVVFVRVLQAALSTLTCLLAARLAWRLTHSHRAELLGAALLAFSPAFVLESAQIASETVFMFLLAAGVWAAVEGLNGLQREERQENGRGGRRDSGRDRSRPYMILLAALLLGLATLTRAQTLLYPVGVAGVIAVGCGAWQRVQFTRRGIAWAAAFLLVYAATVGTWTAYNLARYGRLVIAGEGFAAFLYVGATGWAAGEQVDERLTGAPDIAPDQADFAAGTAGAIAADTGGYLSRRLGEWVTAFTQPHGTEYLPGESIRDLVDAWWQVDRTPSGLLRVFSGDYFLPKLAIYGFHYGLLAAGLVGIWRTRRMWRAHLPMSGYLLYTGLLHLVLFALPRYVFPTFVFWAVFAARAVAGAIAGLRVRRSARRNRMG